MIPTDTTCYHRANRAGAMLILITLCQYGIPALFLWILRRFGIDITARAWALPSAAYLLLYLIMYLLMMGIPLLLYSRVFLPKHHERLSPLNLSFDRCLCVVTVGVALCILANIVASLFSAGLYRLGVPEPELLELGDGSFITLLFDLIVFAVVPAVMEEVLLRGMVLQSLRPLGDATAVGISALLFGLMHGNVAQIPYAILMGLVLGLVFVYTDDLKLTIIIHAIANALSVITSFLLQFFDANFASFWELVILIVVLMTGGIAFLWLVRHPLERTRQKPTATPAARRAALLRAPLLWLAFGLMVAMMIVFL